MLAAIEASRLEGDGQTVGFEYRDSFGRTRQGLVVRHGGEYVAFRNHCPHWSTPLTEGGDGVFDAATGELVCQTHGARFDAETGECLVGPCRGQSLEKLRVDREDDRLVIRRSGLATE